MDDLLLKSKKDLSFPVVFSGPSGCGKTTIISTIIQKYSSMFILSVSHTTRGIRLKEKNGVDYFFCSEEEFHRKKESGLMLESARVYGNLYGTHQNQYTLSVQKKKSLVFDIDWQGAVSVRNKIPSSLLIFIALPSLSVQRKRLAYRGDSEEEINHRLSYFDADMKSSMHYDYVVMNDDREECLKKILCIVIAHCYRVALKQGCNDVAE